MTTERRWRWPSAASARAWPPRRRCSSLALLRAGRGRAADAVAPRSRAAASCWRSATAAAQPTPPTSPPSSSVASWTERPRAAGASRCPTTRRRSRRSPTTTATSTSSPARSRRSARRATSRWASRRAGRRRTCVAGPRRRRAQPGLTTIGAHRRRRRPAARRRRPLHRGAVRRDPAHPGGPHPRRPRPVRAGRAGTSPERGLPRPRRGDQPQGARGRVRHLLGRTSRSCRARSTGCRLLAELGVPVVVVTNQRGIARGRMSEADLADIHDRMRAAGGRRRRPHRRDLPLPARGRLRLPQAGHGPVRARRGATSGIELSRRGGGGRPRLGHGGRGGDRRAAHPGRRQRRADARRSTTGPADLDAAARWLADQGLRASAISE